MPAAELVVGENVTSFGSSFTWYANFESKYWPNLVHVEGMEKVTNLSVKVSPKFTGSSVTNAIVDLLPPGVEGIPYDAFKDSKAAGTVLDLPTVVYIGANAFYGTAVTDVIVTNSAFYWMGSANPAGNAFSGASALKSLAICATNFDATTHPVAWSAALPKVPELWFTEAYPEYFIGGCRALAAWTTFDSKHDTYIYASKKQPGWKEHVLPVSEFTAAELELRNSDPKLGSACFGIVTNYVDSNGKPCATMTKRAWAVHRPSPADKTTGFLLIVR